MEKEEIDKKVKALIEKRLLRIPEGLKKHVPSILLKEDVSLFTRLTSHYYILALVDANAKTRINKLLKRTQNPFPGLVTTSKNSKPVMFAADDARNFAIGKMTLDVGNGHSLYVGKDSTLMLYNLRQVTKTKELGSYEYDIDLAYVISFGDKISHNNILDFLEDLIAYSFKCWKSTNE